MKSALTLALILVGGLQRPSQPLALTPTQLSAWKKGFARFMDGHELQGLRSLSIEVRPPTQGSAIVYDPKVIRDAIELELRRSGIKVAKVGDDSPVPIGVVTFACTSIPIQSKTGESLGFAARADLTVSELGFSEGWRTGAMMNLYEYGSVLGGSDNGIQDIEEAASRSAKSLCLKWLQSNP